MRRAPLLVALSAALAASLAFTPQTGNGIEVGTDQAGDAGAVNNQAASPAAPPVHPVTAPLSYDPADLRSATYRTEYTTTPVGDDGYVVTPTAALFEITTTAAPKSDGPTLIYRISASINGCPSFIQAFVAGPAGVGGTPNGRVNWRRLTANVCPGNVANTVTNTNWTYTIDQATKTLRIRIPFEHVAEADKAFFAPGRTISAGTVEVRSEFGGVLTAPMLDQMNVIESVIGADAPASRGCTQGCPF